MGSSPIMPANKKEKIMILMTNILEETDEAEEINAPLDKRLSHHTFNVVIMGSNPIRGT